MSSINLSNPGPRPFVLNRLVEREDGALISSQHVCNAGETIACDGDNRSVQIYAIAQLLEPVDAVGKKWLKELRGADE